MARMVVNRYDRGNGLLLYWFLSQSSHFSCPDEDFWPDHGEIDVLEGINNQTSAKTALHTSAQCSMYAHVPSWSKTGTWDRASTFIDLNVAWYHTVMNFWLTFACSIFFSWYSRYLYWFAQFQHKQRGGRLLEHGRTSVGKSRMCCHWW